MYLGGIFHIIPTIRLFKKFATTTEKNMDKKMMRQRVVSRLIDFFFYNINIFCFTNQKPQTLNTQ